MQQETTARGADSDDQLWLVEHAPVFTLGLRGAVDHILDPGSIPVVHSDRGGHVTYHGPGQLVAYALLDLRRLGIGIRQLVNTLEQTVINILMGEQVVAERRINAPGVYVEAHKLAALGLRVRRGCSYHGLALNVDMDLSPFSRINPCGYPNLKVTQLRDLGLTGNTSKWGERFAAEFSHLLNYTG